MNSARGIMWGGVLSVPLWGILILLGLMVVQN